MSIRNRICLTPRGLASPSTSWCPGGRGPAFRPSSGSARLAGELHADVLPDLSAVIRDIEAGASPAEAAQRLQAIALEIRDLMSVRRIPALDELGLVAALEWLAERVQDQTGVRVELDIAGSGPRPPREEATASPPSSGGAASR